MKPAWDQLGDEYAASSSVLIGDVDCTADGQDLCTDFGIQGYPTIKYFKDGDEKGEDYQGGRDFDSLKKFTEENLEIMCDIKSGDECTDKEKGYIDKMKAKSADEIKAQLDRLNKMKGSSMKAELKKWLGQRLRILKGLHDEL
mmetsp:Transcript_33926/g.48183  ORF Transcript_33926/g.48183 Transcript_33926/m.48183 type:complete len:143 (+) Transcript_33926:162-590(+)|eukprot:CAMPEP_0202467062 /NCGR_PEP_ID=MMETSP1360-20130828/70766_1 /ASSEMBLY_ACC=CAM_ASM_000848 /TAXON_ID=515479 /ORGANISM="Licmophora paradoxa, Strain CCMP2313" /LENGTH=142 /DNA_ID=CAMNT_0049091427 /DNA_START=151 /DNA_END=579 /DNA_ORIENTATION=+